MCLSLFPCLQVVVKMSQASTPSHMSNSCHPTFMDHEALVVFTVVSLVQADPPHMEDGLVIMEVTVLIRIT